MVKHIVCFKFINNDPKLLEDTKALLLTMKNKIDYLIDIKVGIDFLHSSRSYDLILETYFKDQNDLDLYQKNDYHTNVIKKHMHEHTSSSISIDYEIEDFKYEIKDHQIGGDFYDSKKALFEAFFGDFYDFILTHGGIKDLEEHHINNKQAFYDYASWFAGGQDSCYAMGFAFHKYYLDAKTNATIESQSDQTFIGYCYKNNKYQDFINFLITFFAWWRNDEGCTCFDPYNHADEFFNSSWAALVDTCKLFYLNSETVYHWQSFRVKYALDHIPGVILKHPTSIDDKMVVAGYEFLGFTKENDIVFASFKRKDTYNYWEKEEKKIKKVCVPNYKKADPA